MPKCVIYKDTDGDLLYELVLIRLAQYVLV